MSTRKSLTRIALALTLVAPAAAFADGFWVTTNDEPGSRIVAPAVGSVAKTAPAARAAPLANGAISADRQYVFLGEEGGWQLRPMQYAFQGGRLVHVDDPEGHMHRLADNSPLTEQERIALERSAGG
jgi:hypothetical protein